MIPEIIAVFCLLALGYLVFLFNSLVTARNRVDNSWAQIDVQLKKRADLIVNLVEVVKGYAKHEKGVFVKVAEQRAALANSRGRQESIAASSALMQSFGGVLAIAESYPDLKASANYIDLQKQLAALENDIARARMVYNDIVTIYNTKIMIFPANLIASMLGFRERALLEASEIERSAIRVKV